MIAANAYIAYLAISFALTLLVAEGLHRKGRPFLLDSFRGNEALAKSLGHLRIVSFCLVTVGFVAVTLPLGTKPIDLPGAIEYVSWKVGVVLLMLGLMHAISVCVLSDIRRRALKAPPPPA